MERFILLIVEGLGTDTVDLTIAGVERVGDNWNKKTDVFTISDFIIDNAFQLVVPTANFLNTFASCSKNSNIITWL